MARQAFAVETFGRLPEDDSNRIPVAVDIRNGVRLRAMAEGPSQAWGDRLNPGPVLPGPNPQKPLTPDPVPQVLIKTLSPDPSPSTQVLILPAPTAPATTPVPGGLVPVGPQGGVPPGPVPAPGPVPVPVSAPSWFDRELVAGVANKWLVAGAVGLVLVLGLARRRT